MGIKIRMMGQIRMDWIIRMKITIIMKMRMVTI